jgi:excisionase family DNA binding protein
MSHIVSVVKERIASWLPDRLSGRLAAARFRRVPDWLTVKEAAEYLKVGRKSIYRFCDSGLLPYYELKSGGGRRFKREDLDALLEARGKEGAEDGQR